MMSALGHSRRLGLVGDMSGLPQTADISGPGRQFAFGPGPDISGTTRTGTTWQGRLVGHTARALRGQVALEDVGLAEQAQCTDLADAGPLHAISLARHLARLV